MGAAVTESTGKDGQTVRTVKEGKATILVPEGAEVKEDRNEVQQVFYNPIQQYNRDLSILAIKTYGEQTIEQRLKDLKSKKGRQNKKRKRGEAEPEKKSEAPEEQSEPTPQEGEAEQTQQQEREAPQQKPSFKILDALSASGLRALRYGHELPFVTSVTANDLSPTAAESIRKNVKHNGLEDIIRVSEGDALGVMYRAIADDLSKRDSRGNPSKDNKFDVIDLDPYGTAAPFFDAAVQAVRDDGGLLAVTCTDSALWAGHCYTEKAFALYGGIPAKGLHSHESGLRLILHAVGSSAARYGLHIEPLVSLSIDYYTKLFIKVTKSPAAVKFHGSKTMVVYGCDSGCGAWVTQPLLKAKLSESKKGNVTFYKHGMHVGPTADRACEHCGSRMHLSGPMYAGPIHSREFVEKLLKQIPEADSSVYETLPRLEGMLNNVLEEFFLEEEKGAKLKSKDDAIAALDDYPFFIMPARVASALSSPTPPEDQIRGALKHLGYQVGTSHCRPGSIKTNAPWSSIWWVFVEWIRQKSPVKAEKIKPGMPAWKILNDRGYFDKETKPKEEDDAKAVPASDGDITMEGDGVSKSAETAEKPDEAPKTSPAPTEEELRKTLVFNDALAQLGRKSKPKGVVRYQTNPRSHWGPLARASAR
jgi:tRNA (guanine26-N2/guanine27-N2)-dimethyltransferase